LLDPPVDIDGWSKYLLGWVEAVTVERDGEYTIHTLDKPDEPHGLIIPINDKEYYFIHARRPVGTTYHCQDRAY
jgi:predicted  nucleic acid-binding Zn-ribbon protein